MSPILLPSVLCRLQYLYYGWEKQVKFEFNDVLRLYWSCIYSSLHYLSIYSGKYLVRVRAQVMMRDDSTGGWLPMGGGGLSNVSVRKRAVTCDRDESKHEYLIFGKRISDQSVSVYYNHKSVVVLKNINKLVGIQPDTTM